MQLDEYQEKASVTSVYPKTETLNYLVLGLVSEAGELASLRKKILRGDGSTSFEQIALELGDVLWYVSELSKAYGLNLDFVAKANLKKLADRKLRGTIKGNGDLR